MNKYESARNISLTHRFRNKCESARGISLTPCFSKVDERGRETSTVLTRILHLIFGVFWNDSDWLSERDWYKVEKMQKRVQFFEGLPWRFTDKRFTAWGGLRVLEEMFRCIGWSQALAVVLLLEPGSNRGCC